MKTKHPLKIGRTILTSVLCSAFAATAAFGQSTTFIWTNQLDSGSSAQIGVGANWNPNGVPSPNSNVGNPGDTMQWDGQTVGPMYIDSNGGLNGGSSAGVVGIVVYVDGNQVWPVNIYYSGSGANGTSIRTSNIQVDSGGGTLSLGNTNSSASAFYMVFGGTSGQIHYFVNNSTNPVIMYPALKTAMGGGGAHTFDFGGSGNWYVTNSLYPDNSASDSIITKDGTGTLLWQYAAEPTYTISGLIQGPVTINEGTLLLESGNLLVNLTGSQNMQNNGVFEYFGQANSLGSVANGTISLNISGSGPIQMGTGVLTLSGANTYTGTNILTGGELIAGSVETANPTGPLGEANPPQGSISFQGGILGYSAFNGFDYSPRFDTSPGQQYLIDTASQNVTFTNALTSVGGTLTKLGGGSLTLAGANTYGGLTTANSGKLVLAGTASSGNILVNDNAALGVVENGTAFTPNTLTLGTNFGATFEGNNVTNKNAAPMQPAHLVSSGLTTVNVNSGRFRNIGDTFPLLTWGSGTAPGTTLAFLGGAGGHLTTNANTIDLVIDQPPYIWTGGNNGSWDASTPNNWEFSGSPVAWANGNYALFDDTLAGNNSVTLSGVISGKTITFDNINTNYTLNSSAGNDLGGSSSLTLAGSGITTLSGGANTYTGVTTITGGGILVAGALASGLSASDIGASANVASNLVINGGTLQYTGAGASIDRLFTVGTAGATIDNEGGGTLALFNPGAMGLSSSGTRTLTLTGVDATGTGDSLNTVVGDGGGPTSLVKNGPGNWTLLGTNTYSGGTTIVQGELFVGNGGSGGTVGLSGVNDATAIDFNRSGTVTVTGPVIGAGTLTNDGSGTVILANDNTYTGGTEINHGTLQLGNGGGTGSLNGSVAIDDESLLVFDSSGAHAYSAPITGAGNIIVQAGQASCYGANTYTGWTYVGAGAIFQPCNGNQGALVTSVITNLGTVRFDRQDNGVFIYSGAIVGSNGVVEMAANNFNPGDATLTGSNSYTGGTFIGDNILILGDNSTPGAGAIQGNVTFTNNYGTSDDNVRVLEFNRPSSDNFTFSGNIVTNFATPQNNLGAVLLNGSATVTLTGNNTYGAGTTNNGGILQIGNGGSTGSVGSGPVAINNGNEGYPLLINRSGTLAIPGQMTGGFNLQAQGGVTLVLGGSNMFSGTTVISNASEFINSYDSSASIYVTNGAFGGVGTVLGPVTLDVGTTLYASSTPSPGAMGTLLISNNLTLGGSNFVFEVNRSASPSNSLVTVTGTLTSSGPGFLIVTNVGPNLHPGDRFVLFNQPLPNGALINVSGGRATWNNQLAFDGSVSVATVSPLPTLLYTNLGNGSLQFSWNDSQSVFKLQWETNGTAGLKNNWVNYPGGTTSPVTVPIARTNATAFFRIISVP